MIRTSASGWIWQAGGDTHVVVVVVVVGGGGGGGGGGDGGGPMWSYVVLCGPSSSTSDIYCKI